MLSQPNEISTVLKGIIELKTKVEKVFRQKGYNLNFDNEYNFAYMQLNKQPALAYAPVNTIFHAFMQAMELGLTLDPRKQQCYLTSVTNPQNPAQVKCQIEIGYRGYLLVATRAGVIVRADAAVVYAKDEFEYYGPYEKVKHVVKTLSTDPSARGAIDGGYVMAKTPSGSILTTTMSAQELFAAEEASIAMRGTQSLYMSAWADEMRKSALLRRAWKQWETEFLFNSENNDAVALASQITSNNEDIKLLRAAS
ncbi:recombinase RecT [Motilimonas eburnea]|uniref:recombinase RecT n=1 Tax=Motilimonas eburnea TaxID=1737488 RepID=UPI001E56756E|nr:recombinase RecT [Motilimonas eburnea]MCE2571671.1 recombinase RecT [Motilimonas eburnea]